MNADTVRFIADVERMKIALTLLEVTLVYAGMDTENINHLWSANKVTENCFISFQSFLTTSHFDKKKAFLTTFCS